MVQRKQKTKTRILPVFGILVAVYAAGGLAGAAVIQHIYMKDRIREILPFVDFLSDSLAEGRPVRHMSDRFIVKAYAPDGTEITLREKPEEKSERNIPQPGPQSDAAHPLLSDRITDDEIKASLSPYIARAQHGIKSTAIVRIGHEKTKSLINGVPVVKNGMITGSVFIIQTIADFQAALRGFYCVFIVSVALGLVIMLVFLRRYMHETEKLESMRREYISNISHELKSPLASIKALSETLSDGMAKDEQTRMRYYSILINESRRLERLVQDMLELSRLQNGKSVFEKERLQPAAVMKEVELKYSIIADDMGISFINACPADLPDIFTSRDRILQLFAILIDNALKYVPAEDGRITISAGREGAKVIFTVADNGSGISAEDLPYIFDRFYKHDKSHSGSGSGLGLSIARAICSGLHEKISVTSTEGSGAVFSFTAAVI